MGQVVQRRRPWACSRPGRVLQGGLETDGSRVKHSLGVRRKSQLYSRCPGGSVGLEVQGRNDLPLLDSRETWKGKHLGRE